MALSAANGGIHDRHVSFGSALQSRLGDRAAESQWSVGCGRMWELRHAEARIPGSGVEPISAAVQAP